MLFVLHVRCITSYFLLYGRVYKIWATGSHASRLPKDLSSFLFTCFSLRVAMAAASDYAATPLVPPAQTAICLDEAPTDSNQES